MGPPRFRLTPRESPVRIAFADRNGDDAIPEARRATSSTAC
jgi:hypothetical protein